MATKAEKEKLSYAPTDVLYPEEDGEPMAVSDLHREQMVWTIDALKTHFSTDPSVYVSGDILMYYVEGSPDKSISPDVLVSFGIGMKLRRTYLVWVEGKVPDFVMEFSSKKTVQKDLTDKKDIYASLNIQDYILYDAEGIYLPSQLMGFKLDDGSYKEITPNADGGIHSSALNLDFHIREEGLGIYDPVVGNWVQTQAEIAETRAETAEAEVAETPRADCTIEIQQLNKNVLPYFLHSPCLEWTFVNTKTMRASLELLIRTIHLIAAIIWFGGIVFSTFITLPMIRKKLQTHDLLELHNRFRFWIRLMINLLLLTGGIVIFIVAWNNGMKLEAEYMIVSAAKLTAFGLMTLFWGLYSSLYRRHLEDAQTESMISIPRHINVFGHLTLFSGLLYLHLRCI